MMGSNLEDIASGIDELMIRQPVGVVGVITPFNFPGMIPLWFLPYAVACGNTRRPEAVGEDADDDGADLRAGRSRPASRPASSTWCTAARTPWTRCSITRTVRAISFVGSTPVARYIYSRAAANGKRVQCQGGAKNPIVVLPDADMEMTTQHRRRLGVRLRRPALPGLVGRHHRRRGAPKPFTRADQRRGRVAQGRLRPRRGRRDGAGDLRREPRAHRRADRAGRRRRAPSRSSTAATRRSPATSAATSSGPTVLADVDPASELARTEVFGPVLSVMRADTVDDAIALVNRSAYGNMACLFTSSGAAARQFRYEARVGNVGINVGVAAPMAYFPFSGWKDSFFGDLHAQGRDAIDFYTEKKVVVERWPATWSRKF